MRRRNAQGYPVLFAKVVSPSSILRKAQRQPLRLKVIDITFVVAKHWIGCLWLFLVIMVHHFIPHLAQVVVQ